MRLGRFPGKKLRHLTLATAVAAVMGALLVPGSALASPSATTQDATDVTATSATLNGTIQSDGLPATWHFDYATDAEYGGTSTYPHATTTEFVGVKINGVPGVPVPTVVGVHGHVHDLSPSTTYHFRVVIDQNACVDTPLANSCPIAPATADGSDVTFTTPAS